MYPSYPLPNLDHSAIQQQIERLSKVKPEPPDMPLNLVKPTEPLTKEGLEHSLGRLYNDRRAITLERLEAKHYPPDRSEKLSREKIRNHTKRMVSSCEQHERMLAALTAKHYPREKSGLVLGQEELDESVKRLYGR
eukprot:NODE_3213_length_801_cov_103.230053_g2681_i0.p1 GENE.NODE_3213_length_801_cov_103.230053_g2681_i0~~NODE_3213_length_801_cov_103.230053_g2681_i0.p1  ORF type:complete len:136 (+),score=26.18 NODE_3213_length_801_cov_103.230053_g2681_i0:317-724(+)